MREIAPPGCPGSSGQSGTIYGDVENIGWYVGIFGDDTIWGGHGSDHIYGDGAGSTTIANGDFAGCGSDRIFGGRDDDVVIGDVGQATLGNFYRCADDLIDGGHGNDLLVGDVEEIVGSGFSISQSIEFGDDTIIGGRGDDILVGDYRIGPDESFSSSPEPGGADTFVIHRGDGHDTILDYDPGLDVINLVGLSRFDLEDDTSVEDGNLVLELRPNQSVTLVEITSTDGLLVTTDDALMGW